MRGKVCPYLYKIAPYPKISPIWLKLARLCVREQVLLARWPTVGLAPCQLTRLSRVTQASRGCDTLTTQNHHHWHYHRHHYHQLSWLEALFLFRKIHLTM